MIKNYEKIRRKEELKELIYAEKFTGDNFWRKELSPRDKQLLKEIEEERAKAHHEPL